MTPRRIVDLGVAGAMLLVTAPLFLLLLAVSRLWTGRPFFTQVRLGRDLQPFVLLKFQTMVAGGAPGSTVTVAGNTRITPYGRVLRTLKLDELPQLLNVLRGEMTLVGPRPLTPNEIAATPARLAAAVYRRDPGLTGASTVAFVDEERVLAREGDPEQVYFAEVLPRKIALELAYAQRRTWRSDLILVLLTPLAGLLPGLRRRVLVWLVPDWPALSDIVPGNSRAIAG